MNNDDRLSSGLNIDMCIEQIESKMSDDIIMQQIYISLCAYKIEIEKLQNENEELKLELSGYRIAILKNDNLLGLQQRIDNAIEFCDYLLSHDEVVIDGKTYIKQNDDDIITNAIKSKLLGGDE